MFVLNQRAKRWTVVHVSCDMSRRDRCGGIVIHCTITLTLEQPYISPHHSAATFASLFLSLTHTRAPTLHLTPVNFGSLQQLLIGVTATEARPAGALPPHTLAHQQRGPKPQQEAEIHHSNPAQNQLEWTGIEDCKSQTVMKDWAGIFKQAA